MPANRPALPVHFVLAALLAGLIIAHAAADNPHVWDPKVRGVAVFKNGLGFFMRSGAAQLRDGWCYSGPVPPALFGTLGIYATSESQSVDLVGSGTEIIEFTAIEPDCAKGDSDAALHNRQVRLESLLGLNVNLVSGSQDRPLAVSGRLTEISATYAILKQGETLTAIALKDLIRAELLDYPIRVHVNPGDGTAAGGSPERAELGMAYLRKGITWIPEYSLRVLDETTAELTLRATLINEAEDLVGADVHFVVGVPSFLHAEFLSPLAVGQTIRTVAAALPPGFNSQVLSNAIMQRGAVAADQRAQQPGTESVPVTPDTAGLQNLMGGLPRIDGAGGSDFTVYTRTGMTVRRGEKALVTIFRRIVRYAHAYRWESPGELKHMLVLENDTDTAWTTGPVVAVSGPRPLCQDVIYYTPRSGRAELPVTTAINVGTSVEESEVDRRLKAHEPSHNVFYDLVTIEGRLRVQNFEARDVELSVRRQVAGLLKSASNDGRIHQDTDRLRLLERSGAVTWKIALQPGEQRLLTYRYERYVESR